MTAFKLLLWIPVDILLYFVWQDWHHKQLRLMEHDVDIDCVCGCGDFTD